MIISSKDNESFKYIKKLKQKKYRNIENKYLIESEKMVKEAVRSNIDIELIIYNEDYDINNINLLEFDFMKLSNKLFKEISSLVNSDGIMALVNKKENTDEIKGNVVVLDRIQDPGNVGTIIRSSEAFGFRNIFSIDSCDFYNEKTLRGSMGSIFRLNTREIKKDYLKILKDQGYKILALDMDGKDIEDIAPSLNKDKICLIVGNEGSGIDKYLLDISDYIVSIQMDGEIESLNAAISVSIVMSKVRDLNK